MKYLLLIAGVFVGIAVLIGMWHFATFDYCPIYYGIECL